MAIDNVFTSSGYNSYFLDLVELDTFVTALDGFWNITSWNSLTDTQKENLMLSAVSDANVFSYIGVISSGIVSPFNMKFPRTNIEYQNGVSIGPTEIPIFMKEYVAIRVLEKNANTQTGEFYDGRIKKYKLGKLEQEFQNPKDSKLLNNTLRNAASFAKISPYVSGLSGNFRYLQRT